MSIFGIYLLFSQIDFLIIRGTTHQPTPTCGVWDIDQKNRLGAGVADICITVLTTTWFLQHKTVDNNRYMAEAHHTNTKDTSSEMEHTALLTSALGENTDIV
jgi:hypothetical protein